MTAPSYTKTYRIKPLVWDEPHPLNGRTNGDLATHASGGGFVTYEIQFVGGKWRWSDDAWSDCPGWYKADSLSAAQAAADLHWREQLLTALEEA